MRSGRLLPGDLFQLTATFSRYATLVTASKMRPMPFPMPFPIPCLEWESCQVKPTRSLRQKLPNRQKLAMRASFDVGISLHEAFTRTFVSFTGRKQLCPAEITRFPNELSTYQHSQTSKTSNFLCRPDSTRLYSPDAPKSQNPSLTGPRCSEAAGLFGLQTHAQDPRREAAKRPSSGVSAE